MRSKSRRVAGEFADSSPERNKWRHPERRPGTPGSPGTRTKISMRLNERDAANGRDGIDGVHFGIDIESNMDVGIFKGIRNYSANSVM